MVTGGRQAMRLGSFNLLSGRSLVDGLIDPERLVDAVAQTRADVLAIQEVDRGQERSAGRHQAADAAAALGVEHVRYVETVRGTPGADWARPPGGPRRRRASEADGSAPGGRPAAGDGHALAGDGHALAGDGHALAGDLGIQGPGYGIALLSRLPVIEWHEMRMPPAWGRFPITIPSRPPRVLWLRDEPRAAVAAVLESPRMTVACTHVSFVPLMNAWQLQRVCRWLAGLPAPRLLLGDLNQPAGVARRVTGWTPLVSGPTYPAPAPRIQLDHVLASGLPEGARTRGEVWRLPVSDHRAVLVDLELPG